MTAIDECSKAAEVRHAVWQKFACAYRKKSELLGAAQERIAEGFKELQRERTYLLGVNEGGEVSADDMIEINAGGTIFRTTRGTLTQQGSTLSRIFSGRWEKMLLRDENGRVFFDVDPAYFRRVVECLNELKTGSVHPSPAHEASEGFFDNRSFQFSGSQSPGVLGCQRETRIVAHESWRTADFSLLPEELKNAFEVELDMLKQAQVELKKQQLLLEEEKDFISRWLHLNKRGMKMPATSKRPALGLSKSIVLAQQVHCPDTSDDDESGEDSEVHHWTTDQVTEWAELQGSIPQGVADALDKNSINGRKLLAMSRQDFWDIGIIGTADLALLTRAVGELRKQQSKHRDAVAIEPHPHIGRAAHSLSFKMPALIQV